MWVCEKNFKMNENRVPLEKKFLDALDYSIIIGMLAISIGIGIYFAFVNKIKTSTTSEYLVGNRELSVFPITMSLVSSVVSGTAFLAHPVEVYMYGSQVMLLNISSIFSVLATLYIFLPVFCNLNILSSYEYLSQRFNEKIGMLGSFLYFTKMLLSSAIVVYLPAIAFSQLSGLKVEISLPILSFICIFYTVVGGVRAVIWADTLQTLFIFLGTLILTVVGSYHIGGFRNVWERNVASGRIEFFNLDPDPRVRLTFWSTIVGYFFSSLSDIIVQQMTIQRCLALPSFKKMEITLWIVPILIAMIFILNGLNGLVAFATFYDCDPITTKQVSKPDQMIPYLWMFLTQEIPALPGFLVSALFSASFSTISTTLNSMAGVFVINVVKPLSKSPISESKATFLMKVMVLVFGCLILILAFLVDKMGALFQISTSFAALLSGPVFGAFVLGMFCPRVGSKAAFSGMFAGFSLVAWIFVGAQIAVSRNQIIQPKKNFSIEGCDNSTLETYYSDRLNGKNENLITNRDRTFPLYAVSYLYYSLIAILATVVVGFIVSYITERSDRRREGTNLYSPIIRKFIRTGNKQEEEVELNNVN